MAGACPTNVNSQGSIPKPTADGACYTLTFPTNAATDFHATVDTTGVANVVFFAEHVPTKFERDTHYFMSMDLALDIEPGAQTDPDEYNCKFHKDAEVKVCAQAFYVIQSHPKLTRTPRGLTRTSLLRAVRTRGAGQLAPGPHAQ